MADVGRIPSNPPPVVEGHVGHSPSLAALPGAPVFSVPVRSDAGPSTHSGGHAASTGSSNGGMNSGALGFAAGLTHPNHIPLTGQTHGQGDNGLHERALALRAYRQQLIASNIANADTPNYKAVDIEIEEALRMERSSGASADMATTNPRHLQGQGGNTVPDVSLKYHVPRQNSVDGNTVELDVERAKFAKNSFMYSFSLDRVSGHYKMMMETLKNLVN